MPRPIDADALKLPSELPVDPYDDPYFRGMYSGWNNAIRECKDLIDSAPTISPDEVRGVGKWIDNGVRAWSCSCCGTPLNHIRQFASFEKNELPNYCPSCGARMEVNE